MAMGVLGAGQAQAVVVTVGGHDWDVQKFTGSLDPMKFNTPAEGGMMPWWGNKALARMFRDKVGDRLGHPTPPNFLPPGLINPLFGWEDSTSLDGFVEFVRFPGVEGLASKTMSGPWAVAVKVPGPLPILGAAAAFGYSRKLRTRIKDAKPKVISTTAV